MRSFVERLARGMAVLGGLVLSLLILMTCLSVLGRMFNTMLHGWIGDLVPGAAAWLLGLGIGPINGDFEIVEAGVAFAIFAFIPLCQLRSGHAVVDVFAANFPDRLNRWLQMTIDCVFAGVLLLIAVQLSGGMLSKMRFGENTFILQFPVWWGYAASLVAAVAAVIVAFYIALVRVQEVATGRSSDL